MKNRFVLAPVSFKQYFNVGARRAASTWQIITYLDAEFIQGKQKEEEIRNKLNIFPSLKSF
jgi:hypothetical protein